jgi:hypothetical protein
MKRILSFDGGGIRGIFSLQIAARIEQHFRVERQKPDLVLADVIDFFAGTSTGAIIAACLAWGESVSAVEALYLKHSEAMFPPNRWWRRLQSKYDPSGLAAMFKGHFTEDDGTPARLGSAKLKPTLLVVMRNATTGSPWPITNNPAAKFIDAALDDCNLQIPIWQLLRASTAAPGYFPPQEIVLGPRPFLFVDGGVTAFNNPALLAVLMATLPCYCLNWTPGRSNLHVVSVGTGSRRSHLPLEKGSQVYLWDSLKCVVPALIGAAADNQDMICRVLGHCVHGNVLDAELDNLKTPTLLTADEQKFSYVRYNAALDSAEIGNPLTEQDLKLDNLSMIGRLQEIGRDYARQEVHREHLWPQDTGSQRVP